MSLSSSAQRSRRSVRESTSAASFARQSILTPAEHKGRKWTKSVVKLGRMRLKKWTPGEGEAMAKIGQGVGGGGEGTSINISNFAGTTHKRRTSLNSRAKKKKKK